MNFKLKYMHWKNQDQQIRIFITSPYDRTSALIKFCGEYALDPIVMRKYKNYLPWQQITINQKLSEETMREFEDFIVWQEVPNNQICSEQFIKEFKKRMMSAKFWSYVPRYQELSEKFIEEFVDELDWKYVSFQDFSEEFAEKFIDKIDWHVYFCHHSCCNWKTVSEGFIKRHLNDKFRNIEILKDIIWAFPVTDAFRNKLEKLEDEFANKIFN